MESSIGARLVASAWSITSPLPTIGRAEASDLGFVEVIGEHALDELLIEVGRSEVVTALEIEHRCDERLRQDAESRLEPWAECLAERAGKDYRFAHRVLRPNAGSVVPLERQASIGRVFEDINPLPLRPALGDPHQLSPTVLRPGSGR